MRYADANVIKINMQLLEEVQDWLLQANWKKRKDENRIQADPRTDSAVPLLYLQRAGDHRQRVRLAEGKRRERRTTETSSRSSARPARTVRSPVIP